ncbi:hypothetical protein LTR97_008373 [Elasticomyces elasticus]|uniref:Major facilitator superfamily (MFS) profile domain-containing protein n=1 Tax=Elasticomyces elasticus TaxID=574655 RepID=A0AAN7ZZ22_9PEZI|nr:hypothetical protein LTR97_008373 [Elasticomyces elasticus]KAK5719279.1 hypothetical protein LTR15_007802 [Elasticomyces elasticus]
MQSYLQYRRFRTSVKAQLERDRAKAQGLGQRQEEGHTPASESSDDDKHDLEKGQGQPPDVPHGVRPGEIDASLGPPLPHEEQGTMEANQRPEDHYSKEETEDPAARAEDEDDDEDDDDDLRQQRTTLSRISTSRSAVSQRHALGQTLTGIDIRKRSTREGGTGDVFVVGYEGSDDPNDPHNWSNWQRIPCTFLIAGIGCVVGLASAIDSSALPQAAQEFGVSEVVESCATGLFLVGFGAGALFAGPISETVGRNPVYIVTLAIYMCFVLGSALAPNIWTQLIMRFLAGLFGSTPLTCAGGSISDLWSPLERVYAFPVFANAAFTGPLLGPIMGGYIVQYLGWRWVDWITLIFSGLIFALVFFFQPETYPPTLLKWKAAHLRALTGDDRYRAEIEIRQESLAHRLKRALYRPFLLTAREPIIILVALYLTVIYIILFTFLDGYTYIFTDMYGISQGLTGVCFVGIVLGLFGASALVPLIYKWAKRDLAKIQEAGGTRLPPEFRLWYSMLGGSFAIPISIFWMGWTARPDISIWSPLAASVFFGYGILCVFITCYQYIIDAYEQYAASALASITLIRYVAAGAMTIVGIPFYKNLGVAYTLTILACLSCLLVPVPYVFYKYGPWIRSKSKYAVTSN